ncbi:MAG: DUF1971 domain-containing protein [Phycisphaeraceae bacterium]
MKQLPDNLSFIQKTPEFDETSISAGLLKAHHTKAGVWGKIVVSEGRLQYTINEPEEEVLILDAKTFGVVEPTVLHEVKPLGPVRFAVEFYR